MARDHRAGRRLRARRPIARRRHDRRRLEDAPAEAVRAAAAAGARDFGEATPRSSPASSTRAPISPARAGTSSAASSATRPRSSPARSRSSTPSTPPSRRRALGRRAGGAVQPHTAAVNVAGGGRPGRRPRAAACMAAPRSQPRPRWRASTASGRCRRRATIQEASRPSCLRCARCADQPAGARRAAHAVEGMSAAYEVAIACGAARPRRHRDLRRAARRVSERPPYAGPAQSSEMPSPRAA